MSVAASSHARHVARAKGEFAVDLSVAASSHARHVARAKGEFAVDLDTAALVAATSLTGNGDSHIHKHKC
jgi:hypothetical protein